MDWLGRVRFLILDGAKHKISKIMFFAFSGKYKKNKRNSQRQNGEEVNYKDVSK